MTTFNHIRTLFEIFPVWIRGVLSGSNNNNGVDDYYDYLGYESFIARDEYYKKEEPWLIRKPS